MQHKKGRTLNPPREVMHVFCSDNDATNHQMCKEGRYFFDLPLCNTRKNILPHAQMPHHKLKYKKRDQEPTISIQTSTTTKSAHATFGSSFMVTTNHPDVQGKGKKRKSGINSTSHCVILGVTLEGVPPKRPTHKVI